MCRHMKTIGNQCHRTKPEATANLRNHHRGADADHRPGFPLVTLMFIAEENVRMTIIVNGMGMHVSLQLLALTYLCNAFCRCCNLFGMPHGLCLTFLDHSNICCISGLHCSRPVSPRRFVQALLRSLIGTGVGHEEFKRL